METTSEMVPKPSIRSLPIVRRLMKGFGASSLGQVVNILSQILITPALIYGWGMERYGEWLILSCIPTYLALSEVGISWAAATEMAMRAARKDYEGANVAFQSTAAMIMAIGVGLLFFVSLAVFFLPINEWMSIKSISVSEFRLIAIVFAVTAILGQLQGLWISAFRCDGFFAFGSMIGVALRAMELLVFLAIVALNSFSIAVIAMCLLRLIGLGISRHYARRSFPWLLSGFGFSQFEFIRTMWKPGIAHLCFPIGNALTVQGSILLVGSSMGPVAVGIFGAHRTLLNSVTQLMASINHVIWPEFTLAYGAGNIDECRRIHRHSCNWSFWISTVAVVCLALGANWIIPFWTLGRVQMSPNLLAAFCTMIVFRTIWYTSSVAVSATNMHAKTFSIYLIASIVSVLLIVFTLPVQSLALVAWCLVIGDLVMCCIVLKQSLALTHDQFNPFVRFVLVPPTQTIRQLLRA